MKYIKSRKSFLSEAKIKDVVLKKQAQAIKRQWGEKFLEYEETDPTDKIKQGRWKLSEEDKNKVLNAFFSTSTHKTDVDKVRRIFQSLPEKFVEIVAQAAEGIETIDTRGTKGLERAKEVLQQFDLRNLSVDEIVAVFEPVFRKLDAATGAEEKIQMQVVDGRQIPVMGEDGRPLKVAKPAGEPVFSKNRVNIIEMLKDYKRYCDPSIDEFALETRDIDQIISLVKDDVNGEYKTSFKLFGRDMYLNITHNPRNILNMSISKYYSSCQHLYTGMYKSQVIGNVFDPNSIPAFLEFDTPIYSDDELISECMPLSRMMLRSLEGFGDEPVIFFDRAYPDRMRDGVWGDVFREVVEKYSGNLRTDKTPSEYLFTPDLPPEETEDLKDPYMDRLRLKRGTMIGKNIKSLHIKEKDERGMAIDWSAVRISPGAALRELTIESATLPENLLKLKMNLEWIKFKGIDIKDLSEFGDIKFESLALEKCAVSNEELKRLTKGKGLKRLSLIACKVKGLDLSGVEADEIRLIYTVSDSLKAALNGANFSRLVVSDDLLQSKDNKEYLSYLKQNIVRDEQGTTVRDEQGKAVRIRPTAPEIELVGITSKKKKE